MKIHVVVTATIILGVSSLLMLSYKNKTPFNPEKTFLPENTLSTNQSNIKFADSAREQTIALGKNMTALQQEVALLRREVADIQKQLKAQQTSINLDLSQGSKEPDTRKMSQELEEQANQERSEALEIAFTQESIDQQWANQTKGVIEAAISQEYLDQSVVQNLECRSNTCRLVLGNDVSTDSSKTLPLLIQRLGSEVPYVTTAETSDNLGRTSLILYLSRENNESVLK